MPAWTFIRHGQSVANAEGWFAGQKDAPLTPLGREQAEVARRAVENTDFDRALCSDLSRAHDTARHVLQGRDVPLEVTATLRERTCGTWEGRVIAELEAAGVMPSFAGWETRPGDGESLRDVALRVCRLFSTMPEVDSTLVVSHGALMRAVIGRVDDTPADDIGAWRPKNCEVVVRDVSQARWRALAEALEG
jgi:broad specificity phosphatase PhoE